MQIISSVFIAIGMEADWDRGDKSPQANGIVNSWQGEEKWKMGGDCLQLMRGTEGAGTIGI